MTEPPTPPPPEPAAASSPEPPSETASSAPPPETAASAPPTLPPIDQAPPAPPGTAGRGPFPVRWAVAGLVTVGVIGAVVAVWLLFGQARVQTVAAAWLPSDTLGYVEVSADLTPGQRDRVLGLLKHFPGFEDQAHLGDKLDESFQRVLAQADIDYRAIVKPWLGDSVAIGFRAPGGAPSEAQPVVVLVASTNDAAANAFIDALAQRARSKSATAATETHRDVRITTFTPAAGSQHPTAHAMAVVDGRLVAGELAMVRAVIDVRHGGAASLAGRDEFRSAIDALPSERIGALWVDAAGLAAGARAELQTLGPAAALIGFAPGSALVGSLHAEDDGIVAEVSGRGSITGAALLSPSPGLASPHASKLAASAPAQTIVFIELHDIGQAITTALNAAKLSDPSSQTSIDQVNKTLALLGTNVAELAGATGDGALAVTLPSTAAAGTPGTPHVALLVEAKDPALATRLVSQIDALAGLSGLGQITTRDERGVTIHSLAMTSGTLPGGTSGLSFALAGDVLIVGTDADLVALIVDARLDGTTLASGEGYSAVNQRIGAENNGAVYVDLAGLAGAFGAKNLSAEEQAFLAPLNAVGLSIRAPGEHEWLGTSRLFVRIK